MKNLSGNDYIIFHDYQTKFEIINWKMVKLSMFISHKLLLWIYTRNNRTQKHQASATTINKIDGLIYDGKFLC